MLEFLLGSHPAIVPMGEIEKLSLQFARGSRGKCSCGVRPEDCEVWDEVRTAVRLDSGVDLLINPFRFRVSDVGLEEDRGVRALGHWLSRMRSRFLRYTHHRGIPLVRRFVRLDRGHESYARNRFFVADVIRRLAGAQIVVDSSKDYLGGRDLYEAANGRLKILFLTRDVRANVYSYLKRNPARLREATLSWVRSNHRALCMLEGIDRNDWLHIKYEGLCADIVGTSINVCKFLGIEFDDEMCALRRGDAHTIGGNRIRYSGITEVREDLAWKEKLQTSQVRAIERIAGSLTRKLSY